jgi:Ca-activated chloride channel homolog
MDGRPLPLGADVATIHEGSTDDPQPVRMAIQGDTDMADPKIEILPGKPALPDDGPSTLDLIVRITPPDPDVLFVRPPINLGLVLDRSGSMAAAKKMDYARDAAAFAVRQLLATDQVSVTIFDNVVETIYPNAPATDKPAIVRQIEGIHSRGATALHAGWKEGADQVERHAISDGLNRVILLSDGLANEGLTDPNVIAAECKARAARGVSTTTMGLGEDYNEDLMQKMGEEGDGNYYFIETPQQLEDIFHTELKGLMANIGTKVSLGIEPQSAATVSEVFNDMDRNSFGRLMLPNLTVGMPITVALRLNVPAISREAEVCRFRLAWDDPKTGERRSMYAGLTLPATSRAEWEAMPAHPLVLEQVAIQMAARARKEAVAAHDRGDASASRSLMGHSASFLCAVPASPQVLRELAETQEAAALLNDDDVAMFRKLARHQSYRNKRGTE